ncbi:MAG: carboxypeptidase regulatory-like domain-containing protein [Alphaproteobacteria bacterium]|nr:carboxypeptidase regulatory-like domain-containing protein [Alphaproteobacteria bacterium]
MTVHIRALALIAALALPVSALPMAALAGGDDYDAASDSEGRGPAYFGFVRDHRGVPVSDARVVLQPKGGEAVEIKTNTLGLYRSHINKDVKPDDVAVSCDKSGYQQAGVQRRQQANAANVETNCTLRRL